MPMHLVVLVAVQRQQKPKLYGSTAAHRFTPKTIGGNGRSFITAVTVKLLGGLGAAIAPRPNGVVNCQTKKH